MLKMWLAAHWPAFGHALRRSLYESLARPVLESGQLNSGTLLWTGDCYDEVQRRWREFDDASLFASMAVRFIILRLENATGLMMRLHNIGERFCKRFAPDMERNGTLGCVVNEAYALHATLIQMGNPEDPRPLASLDLMKTELARAQSQAERLLASQPRLALKLDRIVLTPTGTLLALWHCTAGNVDWLRRELRATFDDIPIAQTELIVHSTLARMFLRRAGRTEAQLAAASRVDRTALGDFLGASLAQVAADASFEVRRLAYCHEGAWFSATIHTGGCMDLTH